MNMPNKKQLLLPAFFLSFFIATAQEKENARDCMHCPFINSFSNFHKKMAEQFEIMTEQMNQAFKHQQESIPVGYEITQDDNFVYIKFKSDYLNEAKVESNRQGNEIVLSVEGPNLKINACINEYKTRLAVEKTEEKDGKKLISNYKQICSLPSNVDLKNVEVKKFKSENSLIVKLEKNESEKIYRIQVTEE